MANANVKREYNSCRIIIKACYNLLRRTKMFWARRKIASWSKMPLPITSPSIARTLRYFTRTLALGKINIWATRRSWVRLWSYDHYIFRSIDISRQWIKACCLRNSSQIYAFARPLCSWGRIAFALQPSTPSKWASWQSSLWSTLWRTNPYLISRLQP